MAAHELHRHIAATLAMVFAMSQANAAFPMMTMGLNFGTTLAFSLLGGLVAAAATYYLFGRGLSAEEARLDGDPYDVDDPDHEPSEVCRRSAARYGETEELLLQSDVLYDRATARLVLRHLAAARALPRLRVRYLVAERLAAQLRPGAVVALTDARLGWSRRVWLVEEVIVRSGTVEIGLICSAS